MNKENCISLINSPPRLNASLKKTPGQNCRFLLNAPFNRENTVQIYSRPFCSSKPTAVESFLIQTSLDSMFCLCSSSDFPNTLYAERFSWVRLIRRSLSDKIWNHERIQEISAISPKEKRKPLTYEEAYAHLKNDKKYDMFNKLKWSYEPQASGFIAKFRIFYGAISKVYKSVDHGKLQSIWFLQ